MDYPPFVKWVSLISMSHNRKNFYFYAQGLFGFEYNDECQVSVSFPSTAFHIFFYSSISQKHELPLFPIFSFEMDKELRANILND